MTKAEIAHFFFLSQCFQTSYAAEASESVFMWERVKKRFYYEFDCVKEVLSTLPLTLSLIQTLFNASAAEYFLNHFGKRRNYSQCVDNNCTYIIDWYVQ